MKVRSFKLYSSIMIALLLMFTAFLCRFNVPYVFAEAYTEIEEVEDEQWTKEAVGTSVEKLRQAPIEKIMEWDSYDSRKFGFVSSVKNQGQQNICWAYGALAAMETSMLREGLYIPFNITDLWLKADLFARTTKGWFDDPLDLCDVDNPNHGTILAQNVYDVGGNMPVVSLVASRWYGVYDFTDNYNGNTVAREEYAPYRMEKAVTCQNNVTQIKELLATYGSVAFAYYASNLNGSYYYAPYAGANHISAIVGWDDNIPAANFNSPNVTKPGAWIVKNSWGKNMHTGGYYYLSYQSSISELTAYDMMGANDYDYNYNYAGNAPSAYLVEYDGRYSFGNNNDYIAAYKAQNGTDSKTEYLKGVSVGVKGQNVTAEIKVYTNVDENDFATFDPSATVPAVEMTQSFKYEGIYTVELPKLVEVVKGKYYLIYVNLSYGAGIIYERGASSLSDNDLTFYNAGSNNWVNFRESRDNNNSRTYGVAAIKGLTVVEDDNRQSIADGSVTLEQTTFTYNGSEHKPEPTVTLKNTTLVAGRDYTVSYKGNVNAGQGTVEIIGIGEYRGTVTANFTIEKADSNASATIDGWTYGENAQEPVVVGNKENGEITVLYKSAIGDYSDEIPSNAGTYSVKIIISETQNYKGKEIELEFTISQATLTDVPNDFTVDSRNKTLKDVAGYLPEGWLWEDEDKQLDLGENTVYAVYMDTGNYTNSRVPVNITVLAFNIPIEDAEITVPGTFTYNGEAITPSVKVVLNEEVLIEGTDYALVYENNTNAGTATIIVTGAGIYSGSQVVNFTIEKQDLSDSIELNIEDAEIIDGVYKVKYDGNSHEISAKVTRFDEIVFNLDICSVSDVNEYLVTVKISDENYCGEKSFTVLVYKEADNPGSGEVSDGSEKPGDSENKGSNSGQTPETNQPTVRGCGSAIGTGLGIWFGIFAVIIFGVIFLMLRSNKQK